MLLFHKQKKNRYKRPTKNTKETRKKIWFDRVRNKKKNTTIQTLLLVRLRLQHKQKQNQRTHLFDLFFCNQIRWGTPFAGMVRYSNTIKYRDIIVNTIQLFHRLYRKTSSFSSVFM